MTTSFTNSGLWEGQAGDPAIKNAWGPPLVTNFTLLESMINGTSVINVAGQSAVTLTVANGAPDQRRELVQQYTGALSTNCVVTLPNVPKYGWAQNSTTGGFNVVLTAGGGTTATVPPDGNLYFYSCDGATNVVLVPVPWAVLNGKFAFAGDTTAGNQPTGQVGEYQFATNPAIHLASGVPQSVTPIALPAGDWDVGANVNFISVPGVTSILSLQAVILGSAIQAQFATWQISNITLPGGGQWQGSIGPIRQNANLPSSLSLFVSANFVGTGGINCTAFLQARRMR